MFFRDPKNDKLKNAKKLQEQKEQDLRCKVPGCNKPLTNYDGPKANLVCRTHQLELREYGGMGRLDRPWSFARGYICEWCGIDVREHPIIKNPPIPWESETHKHQAIRACCIGDHIERKVDGGSDEKENVQTLCPTCNAIKTVLYKDYIRG